MTDRRTRSIAGATAVALVGLFGCGPGIRTTDARRRVYVRPDTPSVPTSTTTSVTTTVPQPVEQPSWSPIDRAGARIVIDERRLTTPGGAEVTLVRARAGAYRIGLHAGSEDPPLGPAQLPVGAGDTISPTERPTTVAAFNGGFKTKTGSGGFEVDGRVLVPPVAGDASLVIDADGSDHIGVWGRTVPTPGEEVVSVRQNLKPLIGGGSRAAPPATPQRGGPPSVSAPWSAAAPSAPMLLATSSTPPACTV